MAISSTDCRTRVTENKPVWYLVPDGVVQYIAKHGLYRDPATIHHPARPHQDGRGEDAVAVTSARGGRAMAPTTPPAGSGSGVGAAKPNGPGRRPPAAPNDP